MSQTESHHSDPFILLKTCPPIRIRSKLMQFLGKYESSYIASRMARFLLSNIRIPAWIFLSPEYSCLRSFFLIFGRGFLSVLCFFFNSWWIFNISNAFSNCSEEIRSLCFLSSPCHSYFQCYLQIELEKPQYWLIIKNSAALGFIFTSAILVATKLIRKAEMRKFS